MPTPVTRACLSGITPMHTITVSIDCAPGVGKIISYCIQEKRTVAVDKKFLMSVTGHTLYAHKTSRELNMYNLK
jgi:hypothetical protein